jgi:hypothetical protein
MSLLDPRMWLVVALAIAAAFAAGYWRGERAGKADVLAEWNAERAEQLQAAVEEGRANAKETQRRLDKQQENQRAQDLHLAAARADAAANRTDAERLREQAADAARQWRDALLNSPSASQLAAAADAIGVCTDLRSRADRRASLLAEYADAARIAGLKCEADYDALTRPP